MPKVYLTAEERERAEIAKRENARRGMIRKWMEYNGVKSIRALSEQAGISYNSLYKWLHGTTALTMDLARELCDFLGIDKDDKVKLLEGAR